MPYLAAFIVTGILYCSHNLYPSYLLKAFIERGAHRFTKFLDARFSCSEISSTGLLHLAL